MVQATIPYTIDGDPVDEPPLLAKEIDHHPFQLLQRYYSGDATVPSRLEEIDDRVDSGKTPSLDQKGATTTRRLDVGEDGDSDTERERAELERLGPAPDGGLRAWGVVAGAWVVLFVQVGFVMSVGQLIEYYEKNQLSHLPRSQISWLGSVGPVFVFGLAIVSGRYFDTHGPCLLIRVGTITCTGALFGLAFCSQFWQFFLAHLCFGLGSGLLYAPCTAVIGHWFFKRRPTAIGIILSGAGVSGVVFPIYLARVLPQLGFRDTILILAGWAGIMFLPAWFVIKARLPPKKNTPWKDAGKAWRDPNYTGLLLGIALLWLNYFTPFFYANQWASHNQIAHGLSSYTVAFLNAGSFFGRIFSGPSAERFGAIETFAFCGIASGVVILGLWTTTAVGTAGTVIGALLYGFFSGAVMSLGAACCAQVSPVREFGIRLGMMWSCAALPVLAGPQITGVIIEHENGGFTGAMVFSGVTIVAGSVGSFAVVFAKKIRRRLNRQVQSRDDDAKVEGVPD